MFMMEPAPKDDEKTQQEPKVMYDNGHDNRVFVSDSTNLPQPHLSRPPNGTTNSYYPNGHTNGHTNGHANGHTNGNPQHQSFRIIENSRL